MIYFVIALMANINGSLGEAAINLGASRLKAFMKVTLPLCRRAIGSSFLIIFTFALGAYELPLLLGPTSPEALPILAHTQYIHPDLENRPYAMALNGIIIIISMICAVAYFRLMQKNTEILNRRKAKKEHNEKSNSYLGKILLGIFVFLILFPILTMIVWVFTERWAWPNLLPQVFYSCIR